MKYFHEGIVFPLDGIDTLSRNQMKRVYVLIEISL